MKNYFKLLDLLFSVSDCVAFEVEAYENIYFKANSKETIKTILIDNFKINSKSKVGNLKILRPT